MPKINGKAYRSQGFTIVEVLFVLGIGGLILSMIFFAIPAITRWNQNTQRKADVSAILQVVSDYKLQNMGNFPDDSRYPALSDSLSDRLKIYTISSDPDTSNVTFKTTNSSVPYDSQASDKVSIYNNSRCPADTTDYSTVFAGSRDIVALYSLDLGDGNVAPQCKQL